MNKPEITELLKNFEIEPDSKVFTQTEAADSFNDFADNYKNYDWFLMNGNNYSDCALLKIAETLCKKEKRADSTEEYKLIGTAFENRFWGDESAIRFSKTPTTEACLLNISLFVDYAADWLYKNRK